MAYSTCPKCENRFFEAATAEPAKANLKHTFIQCSACGAVVGVMDYYNISTLAINIENRIKKLESTVNDIRNNQNTINQNVLEVLQELKRR